MPVVGAEAKKLIEAVEQDRYIANDAALATAKRLAARYKARIASLNPQVTIISDDKRREMVNDTSR